MRGRGPGPLIRLVKWLGEPAPRGLVAIPAHRALPAYVALGHWTSSGVALDTRLELLVTQLAAELSACQWCIDQARHRWRKAFLPTELLGEVRTYQTSAAFTERERAGLALVEAVARHSERDPAGAEQVLQRARRFFAEPEVARIAAAAAAEHFFNPATGAVGRDAGFGSVPAGSAMPWRSIDAGIGIRGLS
ncbi:MAG: carboxymuconolactone decarboxylase family protein [Gemmatimonadales bacterium]